MKTTCCVWCSKPVEVQDIYNDLQYSAVCSQTCKDAEMLFRMYYSDEEQAMRQYFEEDTDDSVIHL